MNFYNLMSGEGFVGGPFSGDWYMAWAAIAILVITTYILNVASKNDYVPAGYNLTAGLIGCLVAVVLITLFGWSKIALLIGFVVIFIVGYFNGS